MVGDPSGVRDLARTTRRRADELRDEARRLAATALVGWVSTGADRWRADLDRLVSELRREADALDEAADLLEAHAAGATATLERIEAARRSFLGALAHARDVLARGADGVSDQARRAAEGVVRAARHAPAAGSTAWLRFRG